MSWLSHVIVQPKSVLKSRKSEFDAILDEEEGLLSDPTDDLQPSNAELSLEADVSIAIFLLKSADNLWTNHQYVSYKIFCHSPLTLTISIKWNVSHAYLFNVCEVFDQDFDILILTHASHRLRQKKMQRGWKRDGLGAVESHADAFKPAMGTEFLLLHRRRAARSPSSPKLWRSRCQRAQECRTARGALPWGEGSQFLSKTRASLCADWLGCIYRGEDATLPLHLE